MNQRLKFHQATFDLLGRKPDFSEYSISQLRQMEQDIAITLPESVREWYSLDGSINILGQYSNDDHPVPLEQLGTTTIDLVAESKYLAITRGLLPIMRENQGNFEWAVQLNGTDDPPVLINPDEEEKGWELFAYKFSDFTYTQIWDWTLFGTSDIHIHAPFTSSQLASLRQNFQESILTFGYPGTTNYRFYSDDTRIAIWSGDSMARWMVASSLETALESVIKVILESGFQLPLHGFRGKAAIIASRLSK